VDRKARPKTKCSALRDCGSINETAFPFVLQRHSKMAYNRLSEKWGGRRGITNANAESCCWGFDSSPLSTCLEGAGSGGQMVEWHREAASRRTSRCN
jgi:hypothetical protein